MTIDALTSSTTSATTSTSSSSTSSNASLAGNYQQFLTLLLSQLQHQDPTNPVDATQYTSQLVQLASLEQQVSNGQKLDTLTSSITALGGGSSAIGYLGHTVQATGDTTAMSNGEASWGYELAGTASSVTLSVADADGNVVYQGKGGTAAGSHSFTWDGVGSDGSAYNSGNYTLTVKAVDASGNAVSSTTSITGKVTSVDSSDGTAKLSINGVSVSTDNVLSVT
ncbi:flagellar hook assembly protein FlgD [Azospirillum canadense]|uniref:flagellar hook assembly protein FlgD n=1 Tax=Azospirillum canadense TaxID=403962 RepID=UPI002226293D|nr:flagellar hook capping FlgD N-terminal domain-containing protein [Azospirillum canadense]MCW2239741.1 flagellar basal-body rod modification protein FlgD [Azospirillum canadense]